MQTETLAEKTERYARRTLDRHGLTERGWGFRWNRRSKRVAGRCKHGPRIIEVSEWVVDLEWPVEEIIDLILHEVAHALVGPGKGHGHAWKRKCVEIGAKPERCYDGSSLDTPDHLWTFSCDSCGRETGAHRLVRPKSCGRCSATWSPQHLMRITSRDGRPVTASEVLSEYRAAGLMDRLPPGSGAQ